MSDIAIAARQIDRLATLLLSDACDLVEWDGEVFKVSIQMIAQRIGWAADMAMAKSVDSIGPCHGDAVDWMMPPVYRELSAQAQSIGGAA